jgi:hypothetical protein
MDDDMARHSSVRSRSIKIVLIIVGLFVAWQFLKLPDIIEAIMMFFLAGQVPLTHIVLSPDAVMRLSIFTAIAVVVGAIAYPFVKSLRRKQPQPVVEADHIEEADILPEAQPAPEPISTVTPAEAFQQQMYVAAATTAAETAQPTSAPAILLTQAGEQASAAMDRIMPRFFTALAKLSVWARPKLLAARRECMRALRIALQYTKIALRWALKELKLFWKWLLPRLKQFDRWLELQVQAIEKKYQQRNRRR